MSNSHEILQTIDNICASFVLCNESIEKFIVEKQDYTKKKERLNKLIEKDRLKAVIVRHTKKVEKIPKEKKKAHAYNNYVKAVVQFGAPRVINQKIHCFIYVLVLYYEYH